MAFYDNKYWILSHIRNSFLYSDDTGMCEMVLHGVDVPKSVREKGKKMWFGQLDDSEEEFDDEGRIHARSVGNGNDDFGARRRRLNTVVRLEKMKKEQQAAALISTVRWKEPDTLVNPDNASDLFRRKEVCQRSPKSALSQLIANHASEPDSPYLEYAKFDGQSQLRTPTRTIKIFLSMQVTGERNYPMTVCVIASAKVFELIGLVCYKYNHEKREPPITAPVSQYSLFIAEDDGSPDADFPCLEPKEVVGKFGFTTLALVRVQVSYVAKEALKEVETGFSALVTADQNLHEVKNENPSGSSLESTDYHSFQGYLLHKVRPKTEITLGISWEHLEMKPSATNRSSMTVAALLWPRPNLKRMQLPMEVIVDCALMETVPPSVAIMYYHTEKRKWCRLRFECDSKTIDQVAAKLRFILEIRGGHYRQEYLRHLGIGGTKRRSLVN